MKTGVIGLIFFSFFCFIRCNQETSQDNNSVDDYSFEIIDSMIIDDSTAAFILYTQSKEYDAMERYVNKIIEKYGKWSAIEFYNSKEQAPKLGPNGDFSGPVDVSNLKYVIASYHNYTGKGGFWHANDSIKNAYEYMEYTDKHRTGKVIHKDSTGKIFKEIIYKDGVAIDSVIYK